MGMKLFQAVQETHNAVRLKILQLGAADFVWHGRNTHAYNRIFVPESGCAKVWDHTAGGTEWTLTPGEAWLLPTGRDYEFDFPEGFRFLAFHFTLSILPDRDAFAELGGMRRAEISAEWRENFARLLRRRLDWDSISRVQTALWTLIARFPATRENLENQLVLLRRYAPLLTWLDEHADAATSVAALAATMNIGPDALSRKFSADFGMPLKSFLTAKLLRRTENLLLGTDESCRRIADSLGFANECYFSRWFRRLRGITPARFRRAGA